MLWQVSECALFKKGWSILKNLLSFQTSVKNKNPDIYQGFSNILQEDCSFFPSGWCKLLKA